MFETLKAFRVMFFAPLDAYEPAGMFGADHLSAVLVCLLLLGIAFKKSQKLTWDDVQKMTRLISILITGMEIIKITYNLYYGYTWLDAWLPLSFCSLFIYALWLSGYGKKQFKQIGDAFILIGCIIGGAGFLIFPTTSLMRYDIWHYLSLYSLFFHVVMIYLGGLYMKHQPVKLNCQSITSFICYFMMFSVTAILINETSSANIMLLKDPFNIPFKFIHELKAASPRGYTFIAITAYLIGPISVSYIINHVLTASKSVKLNKSIQKCEQ